MFNPFVPFHIKMIEGFRNMNHRYLVSQTNRQAVDHFEEDKKESLLITDYEDLQAAKIHYNALTDKYRAILDLEKPAHREKLETMLAPGSRYRLYAAFIENVQQTEKRLNDKYSTNIRNYIAKRTSWRIGGGKTITPKLELSFGELFVVLKHANQVERFKLAELEKY